MGYLHSRGDYGRYRGDPGILGTLGKLAGGVVTALVPGGSVVASVGRALTGAAKPVARPPVRLPAMPAMPFAAPRVPAQTATAAAREAAGLPPKRRRMNVANAKALRRAIRRTDGFVKLARRSLKGTGYTITRRGSSRRAPTTIVETGAGSVHTR